jgi:ligand-binding SRPBCC domain-containing protein
MISIEKHSGIYTLISKQQLTVGIEVAWNFFSNPDNLSKITPDHMGFDVTSGETPKMYQGQIISYKIGILPLIKVHWVTEITHVSDRKHFVDEQRFGPYRMWHHEHFFEENELGVMMTDKVSYKIPFGIIGIIANKFFIKKQLINIFTFRFNKMNEIFN